MSCVADAPSRSSTYLSQTESVFLSLPCEIRLEIYHHLLVLPPTISKTLRTLTGRNHLSSYLLPSASTPADALLHAQILTTCRQCHTEAEPILYTGNIFVAHPTLLTSMPSLPPLQRSIIHKRVLSLIKRWHIQVRLDTDPRFSAEAVASAFNGCDELEIECWQAMYGVADPGAVLGRFAMVCGVKKSVVTGSIGKEWKQRLESSLTRKDTGVTEEWGIEQRDMFGGEKQYELWTHGGR